MSVVGGLLITHATQLTGKFHREGLNHPMWGLLNAHRAYSIIRVTENPVTVSEGMTGGVTENPSQLRAYSSGGTEALALSLRV